MEFAFNAEQLMIRDSAESFLAEVSTSDAIRQAMASPSGFDAALWRTLCDDLAWPALIVPEALGGLGLGDVELCALQEQMGRYLVCSPFYASVAQAMNAILMAGSPAQQAQWLPQLMTGTTATLAFCSAGASHAGGQWNADATQVRAQRQAEGWQLDGEYRYVIDAATAQVLVLVCSESLANGSTRPRLFIVPADTPGVVSTALPTLDQTRRWGALQLTGVRVSDHALMATHDGADADQTWQLAECILDMARIALAAEQMGGAQRMLDMAVAYAKERVQFNRPIASFQAIKHQAADMMLRTEVARSSVYYAACIAQQVREQSNQGQPLDAAALREAACIAKAYCSDAFFNNAADALQMHGGVGFTWEYDVHLFFKRAKASEQYLGAPAWLRERLASQLLDADPSIGNTGYQEANA